MEKIELLKQIYSDDDLRSLVVIILYGISCSTGLMAFLLSKGGSK